MFHRASARYLTLLTLLSALFVLLMSSAAHAALSSGVYTPGQSVTALQNFETMVGKKQSQYLWYQNWDYGFNTALAKQLVARGTVPYMTWEPYGRSLDGINSGKYDTYIRNYANQMKTVPGKILLRPMHEMNANWYPWGEKVGTNTPYKFTTAWKRIVTIFRQQGATNVLFVWSPNVGGSDGTTRTISSYFPGDYYVHYVALDGYNFGQAYWWAKWQSFRTVFGPAYGVVTRISSRPVFIGETSSTEAGGYKAAWIKNSFNEAKAYFPRVVSIVWFNQDKETDWRVNSSSASLTAYRTAMANLSTPVTASALDRTAPSGYISNPSYYKLYKRYNGIGVTGRAYDYSGIGKVTFSIDGSLKRQDYAAPYTWYWDLRYVRTGWHVIKMNIFDKAWNSRTVTKWVYVTY